MVLQLALSTSPFDLQLTLNCGQLFRWTKLGDWWYGVVDQHILKIKQIDDKLLYDSFPPITNGNFLWQYFRLDDDLLRIFSSIGRDEHLRRAIQLFHGLRICRQEPWECLISFICATHKNIPAIKNMILNLSKRFGKELIFEGHRFYTFPKPKDLASAKLEEILKCKLGFRAKWLRKVSHLIHGGEWNLQELQHDDYTTAKRKLLSLPGVGQKVADCVLLFSLEKLEAFPVDVWIKRAILSIYSPYFFPSFIKTVATNRSISPRAYTAISNFGRNYFGEYAGYAQEYLFYALRNTCCSSTL